MKTYASAGLKFPVVTGETGGDDALLKSFGDEAIGLISCIPYTLDLETDGNKRFVDGMLKNFDTVPGQYAGLLYVNCQVVEAGLKALDGDASDKTKLMAAMRAVNLTDTPRGPVKFDHLGNVIGDFYIRKLGKEGAKYGLKLWNKTDQDLPQRQPVLDLRREEVPRAAGLFARLSAAQVADPSRTAGAAECSARRSLADTNERGNPLRAMNFWLVLTVNSVTFGGLLFLLSAGFSLIFGLMRIPNLTHGSLFMLGAYFGATFVIGVFGVQMNFWLAAILATLLVAHARRADRAPAVAASCPATRWRRCW